MEFKYTTVGLCATHAVRVAYNDGQKHVDNAQMYYK